MRTATILCLGLWCAGCSGGSTDGSDTDADTTPTGDTGDTDVPTDTDTDTTPTGDTGTPPVDGTELTFDLSGSWPGTAISVVQFDFDSGAVLSTLATDEVTSALHSVVVADPEDAQLESLSDIDPTVLGGVYVAAAFSDDDGDEVHDPGEVYVGVSEPVLLYVKADNGIPKDLAPLGVVAGWNALIIGDKSLTVVPIDDIPLPLPAASSATVSGTYSEKAALRMATLPISAFGQKTWPTALVDESLGPKWTVTLTDEPPLDHQISGSPYFPDGTAVVLVAAYLDTDADNALGPADTIAYTACTAEGDQVSLTWLPQSDELQTALFLNGAWGWLVTLTEDDFIVLPSPAEGLEIGPCDPPK